MVFNATIQGREGESISCRVFNPETGKWWDGSAWSDIEDSLYTSLSIAGSSRFYGAVEYPDAADIIIEYVDGSGDIIGEDHVTPSQGATIEEVQGALYPISELLVETKNEASMSRKLQSNKAVISEDGASVTIFDDNQVTILYSFEVSEDQRTRVPK